MNYGNLSELGDVEQFSQPKVLKLVLTHYELNEVFPRFFFRYYEKVGLNHKELQRDIYDLFKKFCDEKEQPLLSVRVLSGYLLKIKNLCYARASGNQRCWYGLRRRAEPITGPINPDDLVAWMPLDVYEADPIRPLDLEGKPRRGRPRRGAAIPQPERPMVSQPKGTRWSDLYRLYNQRGIFRNFFEKFISTEDKLHRENAAEVWLAFDKFCQLEQVPTCSRMHLINEIRLRLFVEIKVDEAGERWLLGLMLRVKKGA